jgi:hypothetical protein
VAGHIRAYADTVGLIGLRRVVSGLGKLGVAVVAGVAWVRQLLDAIGRDGSVVVASPPQQDNR